MLGKVVRCGSKGFGFIRTERGNDLFFHFNDVVDTSEFKPVPRVGQECLYDVRPNRRTGKPEAVNVMLL